MRVFRGTPESGAHFGATVATIGNFDGVHLGHQSLLARLRERAAALGGSQALARAQAQTAVLTFEPHPREFFAPESAPPRLSSLREKIEQLSQLGVDRVHVCRFDRRLAAQTAEDFISRVLVAGMGLRHLIIGDDFRFGAGRRGDFAMLEAAGHEYGFVVEAMPTVVSGGERASSSALRRLLAAGELDAAAAMLGRPYSIAGRVVHGQKLARALGFATANIHLKRDIPPLSGIFAVRVRGAAPQPVEGVASLGVRPTVMENGRATLEVHLFDFSRELYGEHLDVEFMLKLRDEEKYADLETLRAQIARDVAAARDYFAGRRR